MALASKGVSLDVIGSNEVDSPELHVAPKLKFLNLQGDLRQDVGLAKRLLRLLIFYARLIHYVSIAKPKIFHILWNNKLQFFDRVFLMLYYKLRGKKIAFTAHNVNAARRDSNDSTLNRLTLKIQYRLADHIFVHTDRMRRELLEHFGVRERSVTVIPFGINNAVANTALTPAEAKQRLGLRTTDKAILFFGAIRRYKGVEYLVAAHERLLTTSAGYRLIIAGEPKKGAQNYLGRIQQTIRRAGHPEHVIQKFEYIPDDETELYFKAADVLVLPYTHVFQSGVLFLAYSFGLPVIATRIGSFGEDILEGRTGFLCEPCDPADLARAIEAYFASDLFKTLDRRRPEIRDYASERHSWDLIGEMTLHVYTKLLTGNPS